MLRLIAGCSSVFHMHHSACIIYLLLIQRVATVDVALLRACSRVQLLL